MLDELRMAPVLRGVRGEPAVDRDAIVRVIVDLGRLAVDWPEISEIELNPLRVIATRTLALDARATVTGSSGPLPPPGPGSGQAAGPLELSRGVPACGGRGGPVRCIRRAGHDIPEHPRLPGKEKEGRNGRERPS